MPWCGPLPIASVGDSLLCASPCQSAQSPAQPTIATVTDGEKDCASSVERAISISRPLNGSAPPNSSHATYTSPTDPTAVRAPPTNANSWALSAQTCETTTGAVQVEPASAELT